MSSAYQNEVHILRHLGLTFDPKADYTDQTKHLIKEMLRYRGQDGALKAVNSVIGLVKDRIHNPSHRPVGCDLDQQRAFLSWLQTMKKELGPEIKAPKAKALSKGLEVEARNRRREREDQRKARTKIGLLSHERQLWNARSPLAKGKKW